MLRLKEKLPRKNEKQTFKRKSTNGNEALITKRNKVVKKIYQVHRSIRLSKIDRWKAVLQKYRMFFFHEVPFFVIVVRVGGN